MNPNPFEKSTNTPLPQPVDSTLPKVTLPLAQEPSATLNLPTAPTATLDLPSNPSATLDLHKQPSETLPHPPANPQAPIVDDDLPKSISRFQIRQRLGEGAFGIVYRAYDPQLDREVALKVAKPGTLTTPQRIQRFFREAKSAANLRHPNIVPLFETGKDGEHYFIASAFIKGHTLEHHIEATDEKGLPIVDAVRIARKLGEALGYAHSQGIIHRDIKPANIMIDEQGEPLLMDFGLAARAEPGEERITQEGVAMGTPAYMAPEQARGEMGKIGPASDQYSLGCTFYEMLTGRTPFAGPVEIQMMLHQTKDPPSVRSLRREVSRDVETICAKSLEKETGKRYENCQGFADDLRRWQDGEAIVARPLSVIERFGRWCKRNPVVASLLFLVVLVTGVGIGVGVYQYGLIVVEQGATKKALADVTTQEGETQKALVKVTEQEGETSRALVKVTEQEGETKKALDKVTEEQKNTKKALDRVTDEQEKTQESLAQNRIPLAEATWNGTGTPEGANELVEAIPERFRNWESAFLKRKYQGSFATFYGHTSTVSSVSFSADGRRLASGS